MANALEAIIAALYPDGGLAPARSLIHRHIIEPAEAKPGNNATLPLLSETFVRPVHPVARVNIGRTSAQPATVRPRALYARAPQ